ncbi:hypothetical protein KKC60_05850 [Patescibacteria group bacterium]|nr:hypothetical protein [Patescibacteria group bacterium]
MMKVQEELVDTDRIVDGSHSIDDFSANRKHVIENDIISHCFKYDLLGHNF